MIEQAGFYNAVSSAAMSRETRFWLSHDNGPTSFSETGPVLPSF
ncbi:MAG TPA: hypothetical protein VHW67_09705 [Solirubrobacteraceae bacterium]|nr:hypothetical protein [Solirubrobacteraceae bacterium]